MARLRSCVVLLSFIGMSSLRVTSTVHAQPANQPAVHVPTVSGVVLDPSGAAVPAAEVSVVPASGRPVMVKTDAVGHFDVSLPSPGPYTVTVVAQGFAPSVQADVDPTRELLVKIVPATVEERVDVVSQARPAAITSSATRTSTPLLEVPQTIDVISSVVLREQVATSMIDAMRNVPGVNSNLGEGRRDQFLIRGFSAQNDTLLDGTRDDAPYYRDVSTVERIEVVKGPAAALFGRGSSGGVINRILKTPSQAGPIAEASLSVGSQGTRRFAGDVGRPLTETLSFRTTAAAENSTSFRDRFYLKRATVVPSLLWATGTTTALAQVEFLSDQRVPDRGIPSIDGRPADVRIGQAYGYPTDDFLDTNVISGSVRIERRFGGGWLVRQVVRTGSYDTSFSNTAPSGTLVAGGEWRVSRQQYNAEQSQQNVFSQSEALLARRFAHIDHVVLAGVELGAQQRSMIRFNGTAASVPLVDPILTRPIYSATAATNNKFDGTTVGVYAQDQLSFGPRWKALVGIRGDRYTQALDDRRPDNVDLERTDANWSPRGGLVYQPTRQTSLYATVSRSFQPSGEGLSLAVNAAELEPETSRNIEGGAKAELFDRRATATVSVFQLDRTNIKTTDPIDPTKLVLVGRQRTSGVEVALEGEVLPKLRAQAGYAFLDAAVLRSNTVTSGVRIEGNRPGLIPAHAANLWLHYALSARLSVSGGLTATGLRYTSNDDLVELPGYTRADAGVSYRTGRVEFALNARNLLDSRYYETAGSNFQIFPGTPRDVVFTIRVAR